MRKLNLAYFSARWIKIYISGDWKKINLKLKIKVLNPNISVSESCKFIKKARWQEFDLLYSYILNLELFYVLPEIICEKIIQ